METLCENGAAAASTASVAEPAKVDDAHEKGVAPADEISLRNSGVTDALWLFVSSKTTEHEALARPVRALSGEVLAVCGLIGAGKTTLGDLFVALSRSFRVDAHFLREKRHTPVLEMYIHSQERFALPFQVLMAENSINRQETAAILASRGTLAVLERPLFGNRVFAEVNRDAGYITPKDYLFYERMMPKNEDNGLTTIVYLHASHSVALERMGVRGETCEQDYEQGYLARLSDAYFVALLRAVAAGRAVAPVPWDGGSPDDFCALVEYVSAYAVGGAYRPRVHWVARTWCAPDGATVLSGKEQMPAVDPLWRWRMKYRSTEASRARGSPVVANWSAYVTGDRRARERFQSSVVNALCDLRDVYLVAHDADAAPFAL